MDTKVDILIIGGGLAGLTNALHLLQLGFKVTLIEKNKYPKHKVCGEYISNEVLPYLSWLDINIHELGPHEISELLYSSLTGQVITCSLPLGGFGISRYALDHYLYQLAEKRGCIILEDLVENVIFVNDEFTIYTKKCGFIKSKIVVGAYGKRGILDQKLRRKFILKKSPWLAIKAHYRGTFPNTLVALHNFKGGYCGVSKVEDDKINICYLTDYKIFKEYKDIEAHQEDVLCKNPHLKEVFRNCERIMDSPLTIGQISFTKKQIVENHIIMIGDSAGLIHPLCGNGMAMAIHSAKVCAEGIAAFLNSEFVTRRQLEENYTKEWNKHFKRRMQIGKVLAKVFREERLTEPVMQVLNHFPSLLPLIIKQTHGKPIQI
jgi:flavin-dependent dehydrogenase